MKKDYRAKLGKVCDYILENLDKDLTLDLLSQVASVSKYHFHRLFAVSLGVNVYTYVQMQRFKKASYQLVYNKELKIIDIAFDGRFESPEAFSRSFKNIFGVTPSQFRSKPDWEAWHDRYRFKTLTGVKKMKVEIIDFKETLIAVLEHHGSPESLNDTVPRFIEWRKKAGVSPIASSRTFGIVYSDPGNTPPEDFRFDVCGEVAKSVPQNEYGIIQKVIPEGRCAVVRHLGSHDVMSDKIYGLYRDWLPGSNEEIRDFPLFFQYLNFFPEVSESELVTDIYLPIK